MSDAASAGPSSLGSTPPTPCFLSSLGSALPSGVLGWMFGVFPSVFKNAKLKHFKRWMDDGGKSAWQFMLFSGAYSFTHCILTRVRQVDDGFNRGAAGCVTGLAVGWSAGPASAAQSCAVIGFLSYLVDFGAAEKPAIACSTAGASQGGESGAEASHAAGHGRRRAASCCSVSLGSGLQATGRQRLRAWGEELTREAQGGMDMLQVPPVMWLGAVAGAAGQGFLTSAPPVPWDDS